MSSKVEDWVRFYKASPPSYRPHALEGILKTDGMPVLLQVLKKLQLEKTESLIRGMGDNGTGD